MKAQVNKWDRSLGTTKREQGIITRKNPKPKIPPAVKKEPPTYSQLAKAIK